MTPALYVCRRTHTRVANPLAYGFPLTAGVQSVIVPDVPARNSYIVVRKSSRAVFTSIPRLTDEEQWWATRVTGLLGSPLQSESKKKWRRSFFFLRRTWTDTDI